MTEKHLYLLWNKQNQTGTLFYGVYRRDYEGLHIEGKTNKGTSIKKVLMEQHNVLYKCTPVTPENY